VWDLFYAETLLDFIKLDYLFVWSTMVIIGLRLMSFALHMTSLVSIWDPARLDGTRNFMTLRIPIVFAIVFSEFCRPFLLLNVYSLLVTNAALWIP
jgi:hypothetical protein